MKQKQKPNKTGEGGITLIALIVMIVVIVILSAVVIRGLIGNDSIIDTTTDVAEDYKIVSYKEEIDGVVQSTIINYSSKGEIPTLQNIADSLEDETWVKNAIVNEDKTLGNGDIIVTVTEGYVFEVFYDSVYGKVMLDYLGKDEQGEEPIVDGLPSLTARYEKSIASIIANARDEVYGIAKLEVLYKDQIVFTRENPKTEERFDVSEIGKGWYKIRAISNSGRWIYTYVRVTNVTDKLTPPIITLSPADPNRKKWLVYRNRNSNNNSRYENSKRNPL